MEFITVEQFLEQPTEVQGVFIDWWEREVFIFTIQDDSIKKVKAIESIIPLFTEEQLIRFIEESAYAKITVNKSDAKQYIIALILDNDELYNMIDTETDNLLQAYWKVACMVAKELSDGKNGQQR